MPKPKDIISLKRIADLIKPVVGSVGGVPATKAKIKATPPTYEYAVIDLEILNFDLNAPPLIKIFDEKKPNLEIDRVEFQPLTTQAVAPFPKLNVPIFLAYDHNPWQRTECEPETRITRIEVHMPLLDHVETVYAQLQEGTFVVPVFWHNIAESTKNGMVYVNNIDTINLFWKAPKKIMPYDTINSIWVQGKIQFRLMNTRVPFHPASIPTHIVDPPNEKSIATDCDLGWKQNFSSPIGIDIYAVYDLNSKLVPHAPGCGPVGIGNCFKEGFVLIKADSDYANVWYQEGRAQLLAHEFGHYLGALPHHPDPDNLMHKSCGWKLEQNQIDDARWRLKYQRKGYNEKV